MDVHELLSPHFHERGDWEVLGTVVHYTAGGRASGSARWFQNPDSHVSAQYVVGRSGAVWRCVPERLAAWHAGVSEMVIDGESLSDGRGSANAFTIGIELANHGLLTSLNGDFYYEIGGSLRRYRGPEPEPATLVYDSGLEVDGWWEPYPDEQLNTLQELLRGIAKRHGGEAARNLVGHEEIAMPLGTRKRDPGPLFPWERFSRRGPRRTSRG
ncbi:hypothetical protein LCGC14_3095790, partial [marine sediment metagenome]